LGAESLAVEDHVCHRRFVSPMLRGMGFANLPDQTTMAAITFCDVVVSHEAFSDGLVFHELVHVEQYRQLGINAFLNFTCADF
jgi:hypothetical protein